MSKEMFLVEVTDLFGGELNYSWVTRFVVAAKNEVSAISMVSRNTGHKFKKYCDGVYKNTRSCIGATVEWVEDYPSHYECIELGAVPVTFTWVEDREDANTYVILRNNTWFFSIRMNGTHTLHQHKVALDTIVASLTKGV